MFLKYKKNILFLKYTKLLYKLLVILWDINIINYFSLNNKNSILKIYLNNKNSILNVKFFSNKKYKLCISYKKYKLKNFFFIILVNSDLFLLNHGC